MSRKRDHPTAEITYATDGGSRSKVSGSSAPAERNRATFDDENSQSSQSTASQFADSATRPEGPEQFTTLEDTTVSWVRRGNLVWSPQGADPLMPFSELPDPKRSGRLVVNHCAIQFVFTGPFTAARDSDECGARLVSQVHKILGSDWGSDDRAVIPRVTFPRGGTMRLAEIWFPRMDHFTEVSARLLDPTSTLCLTYKGAPLRVHMVGLKLPPRTLVASCLDMPGSVDAHDVSVNFRLRIRSIGEVLEAWQIAREIPGVCPPTPTGELMFVIRLRAGSPSREHVFPSECLRELPGWLSYAGRDHELVYPGRLPACNRCKSGAKYYHTFEDCPSRRCHKCGKPGHVAAQCTATSPEDQQPPATSSVTPSTRPPQLDTEVHDEDQNMVLNYGDPDENNPANTEL